MRVPCGSRPRLKSYAGSLDKCRIRRLKKRVNAYRAGEPVRRSFAGRLGACSFDFHFVTSFLVSLGAVCLRLAHPNAPRNRPRFLIGYRMACQLKGQLDLSMMVTLMPDHVLKQEDWMVVMKVHGTAFFHSALHRVTYRFRAVLQKLRHSMGIV